jgi:hypothetical protein
MAKRRRGRPTPQPPAPPPLAPATPQAPISGASNLTYTPTVQSQLTQPMLDMMTGASIQGFPNVMQNITGQQGYANMYGQGGAQQYGNFMQGLPQETGLTTGFGGQAGGTLGAYGQVMDPNVSLIQGYQQELQKIQAGAPDFDPMLTQQWNTSEQQLRDQLRSQLGPDYATSSAGINALNQFNQQKNTSVTSAQFNRSLQLQQALQDAQANLANQSGGFANIYGGQRGQAYNQGLTSGQTFGQFANDIYNTNQGLFQGGLTGTGQNLGNIAGQQNLMTGPALQMGQIGGALTGQGGSTIGATAPYQQDRFGRFQASTYPTSGQFMGQMMAQSGNRWADIGSSIGSMGGGSAAAGAKAGA